MTASRPDAQQLVSAARDLDRRASTHRRAGDYDAATFAEIEAACLRSQARCMSILLPFAPPGPPAPVPHSGISDRTRMEDTMASIRAKR